MLDIARGGLTNLNCQTANADDECIHLVPLLDAVSHNRTQAEHWLDAYRNDWNGDIEAIFQAAALP